jgi:hypothetical protein
VSAPLQLAGERFGLLRVLERAGSDRHGGALWRCACDCGREVSARGTELRRGSYGSCGCRQSGAADLAGRRFGRLVVGARDGNDRHGNMHWRCACDCGAATVVGASNLRSGAVRSCGCLAREGVLAYWARWRASDPATRQRMGRPRQTAEATP